MADVYRIGISIAATNNASAILTVIARDLMGVHHAAEMANSQIGRMRGALIGLGAAMAGGVILRGLGGLVEHGRELVHQQALMTAAGMTQKEVAEATASAWKTAGDVLGSSVAQNAQSLRELRGILGTVADAKAALPEFARAGVILQSVTGQDSEHAIQTLAKALELRGGVINPDTGHIDPARFGQELNLALKAIIASGGLVNQDELFGVMKQAGPMARMMQPELFYKTIMTAIMEMGGQRAGTALTAIGRALYGGIMPERNAREMLAMGLIRPGGYEVGRGGHIMLQPGAMQGMDILNKEGMAAWVEKVLRPALESHGFKTTEQQQVEMYRLLPTETARRLMGLYLQQAEAVQRDAKLFDQAQGTNAYDGMMKDDPTAKMKAFKEAWDNLLTALGAPLVQPATDLMMAMTRAITGLSQWAARPENQAMIRVIEEITAALAALMVVGGTLAVTRAALAGVAYGFGLFGSGSAAATGMATLTGAAGLPGLSAAVSGLGSAVLPVIGLVSALAGTFYLVSHGFEGLATATRRAFGLPDTVAPGTGGEAGRGGAAQGQGRTDREPSHNNRPGPYHPADPAPTGPVQKQSMQMEPIDRDSLAHAIAAALGDKLASMVMPVTVTNPGDVGRAAAGGAVSRLTNAAARPPTGPTGGDIRAAASYPSRSAFA